MKRINHGNKSFLILIKSPRNEAGKALSNVYVCVNFRFTSSPLLHPLDILVPFRRMVTVNEREGRRPRGGRGLEIFADRSRDPVLRNQQLRKKHGRPLWLNISGYAAHFSPSFSRHCFAATLLSLFLIA